MKLAPVAIMLALWLGAVDSASADERILHFQSDIVVREDGGLDVTETVRVQSAGNQIRHGIYRDFPTDYRDRLGNRYRVGFDVRGVSRDGLSEPYHLKRLSNGVRIYVGNENRLLTPDIYTYQIVYRTTRQLGFFDQRDELYWNVTGTGWGFVIDEVRGRVTLPAGIDRAWIGVEGYTGPFGASGVDYHASVDLDGTVQVVTTRRLRPHEGLTIAVTWPKGFVTEPTALDELRFLLTDNVGLLVALVAALTSLGYLFYAWHRVGRDPPAGVIFPHYEPPGGFSPASLRYVRGMGYDSMTFTAALLNLAVKGLVEISEDDGEYTVYQRAAPDAKLASGERALLASLFEDRSQLLLEDDNYRIIQRAMSAHEQALSRHYKRTHFMTNQALTIPAWLIFALSVAVLLVMGRGSLFIVVILAAMVVGFLIFGYLLKAHTQLGRKLLNKVEGFKTYLEVAEQDELNLRNPPDRTPELFESYLPFALALGVEQPWAEQFTEMFQQLQRQTGQDYRPGWYSGRWDSSNPVRFASDMGSSLSSAVSSASTPPGSSSGSGGGGSSGGGGGGGGGGGW